MIAKRSVMDPEVVRELTREMCAKAAIDTDAAKEPRSSPQAQCYGRHRV